MYLRFLGITSIMFLLSSCANMNWLEHTIAKKSELMIADGLYRDQRIVVRDEIALHQQQQSDLYSALPELKYEFENALHAYEQGKDEFSHYLLTE